MITFISCLSFEDDEWFEVKPDRHRSYNTSDDDVSLHARLSSRMTCALFATFCCRSHFAFLFAVSVRRRKIENAPMKTWNNLGQTIFYAWCVRGDVHYRSNICVQAFKRPWYYVLSADQINDLQIPTTSVGNRFVTINFAIQCFLNWAQPLVGIQRKHFAESSGFESYQLVVREEILQPTFWTG